MSIASNFTNSPKYRTRRLYLKCFDCLQKHPNHFERNIIGLGYTSNGKISTHRLSVAASTARIIELNGKLICLAEFQFDKKLNWRRIEMAIVSLSPKIGRMKFSGGRLL